MARKSFWRVGHAPTLLSSFLYFDISFMIWNLLGALGVFVAESFALTPAEKGMMVAIPVLGGALLRIPMGLLADRWGGKRAGLFGMAVTAVPLVWGWQFADRMSDVYALGFLLGVAEPALPLRCRLRAAGIRKNIKGWPWGSPGPETAGRCWRRCLGRGWRKRMDGTRCLDWRLYRLLLSLLCLPCWRATARRR